MAGEVGWRDVASSAVGAHIALPPAELIASVPVYPPAFREIGLVWFADRPLAPAVRAFGDYAESGAVGAWSVRAGTHGPIVLTA